MGEYDKKPAKAAPTAGPAADDRYGAGKIATNLETRILKCDIAGGRTIVTLARGSEHGVREGMEGYVKGGAGGAMLSELQITSVRDAFSLAAVEVTPDQLTDHLTVVINPTTMPRATIKKDTPTRVLGVSVEDGRTKIIIARGSTHGVSRGMQGSLRAANGDKGYDFTIEGTTAMQSYAYVEHTVAHVNAHPNVVLHPKAAATRPPIQRRANGAAASTADVQSTAQAGVAGAASRLPHFDTIQRAFGKHDISGIQAQVGGAAADASNSLGARAYATGNKVAFASAPDLHTAAHEAAHTIQQARGTVGFQGLGAADDEHERHADAVADAVVAGRSAEALLDREGAGTGAAFSVQRKELTAKDFVKTDDIAKTPVPGKGTKAPQSVGDAWIDHGAACDGRDGDGCFLDDATRGRLISEFRVLVLGASFNYKLAIAELRVDQLMTKDDDLPWVVSLALDLASAYVIGNVIKTLNKVKAGKLAEIAQRAALNGDYYGTTRTEAILRFVSDEQIKERVKAAGGFASKKLAGAARDATTDTQKAASLSYLNRLRDACGVGYTSFARGAMATANDAELLVLWDGMQEEDHTIGAYKMALGAKLERFKKSGVTKLGRRNTEHSTITDRRVVWRVTRNEKGEQVRTLWFQKHVSNDDPTHVRAGEPGFADVFPKHKDAFGELGSTTAQLDGVVPDEFVNEALAISESRFGATPVYGSLDGLRRAPPAPAKTDGPKPLTPSDVAKGFSFGGGQ